MLIGACPCKPQRLCLSAIAGQSNSLVPEHIFLSTKKSILSRRTLRCPTILGRDSLALAGAKGWAQLRTKRGMVASPSPPRRITWDCEGDTTGRRGEGEENHIGYRRSWNDTS